MIVSKCPVRISLAGGSTDLDNFVSKYGKGTVISFSADIFTYITLKTDRLGLNGLEKKYVIDYMKREVTENIADIKNDVARVSFDHFKMNPTTVWFTSDIYASGSGLASSTSYLISLVNALSFVAGKNLNKREICKLAHQLEKKFNPLIGYQDSYGCGMGGFNKFEFHKNGAVFIESLDTSILEHFDMFLIQTGLERSSTDVLKTIDPEKCFPLLDIAEEMHRSIVNHDVEKFLRLINEGWSIKKKTGKIADNSIVMSLDKELSECPQVLAHRLLGAGNGGYFLIFSKKNEKLQLNIKQKLVKVNVFHEGPLITEVK